MSNEPKYKTENDNYDDTKSQSVRVEMPVSNEPKKEKE
jgi:hypothetical protein